MPHITLPTPVQAVVDAINAADTDAFVAAFTEDGAVDDWGRVLRGRSGQRSWADTDAIGAGARITVLEADTVGDVTEIRFTWESRVFNGESSAVVTVDGDHVSLFRIPPHA
ncbi:nuclear transport factor 2 family protein [Leucobacter rhizosphaerae]|uniref:Nuclear transport factor 2 family protein n=1 Tax=Leucobacter rhizosphaerae TaxID=2932245 RepID=A0ABY4FT30_9MICO|nr:nuclear transport factor 2 family protein [Leucobacter rhizosphaerae]UOQ59447.1 nuclear transport factor 2 family protein [Leucobacter rhizosphaerae]